MNRSAENLFSMMHKRVAKTFTGWYKKNKHRLVWDKEKKKYHFKPEKDADNSKESEAEK
jgi:hypothetical protein